MEGATGEKVIPSAPRRRLPLILEMQRLSERGHHCGDCSGICCTYLANSMQITPVEAMDLKQWLQSEGRWNASLIQELRDCVAKFRLDYDLGDGRRSLRRTYTCPFYRPGPLGCSISPEHKPYGCLAFNARAPGLTNGGNCKSDSGLLESLMSDAENALNLKHKEEGGLFSDKAPIPIALLNLAT